MVAYSLRYLELSDWDLKGAMQSVKEDQEWEREGMSDSKLKSGEIRINTAEDGVHISGAGISVTTTATTPPRKNHREHAPTPRTDNKTTPQVVPPAEVPDIATKTTKPQHILDAAPQHSQYGLELQSLSDSCPFFTK